MMPVAGVWQSWPVWAGVLAASLGVCALYCGIETGIYVLNKVRLDLRADAGARQARMLQRMLRGANNLLIVLLVGTNLAAYTATSAVAALFVLAGFGEQAEWYTLGAATLLLFVLGDSVPKNVFRRLAERLVYRLVWFLAVSSVVFNVTGLAPLIRGISWLLTRLVHRPGPTLADERLAAILAEGHASGVLTHLQSVMADRVMHIGEVTLADVMVPASEMAWIGLSAGRAELIELVQQHNYSRMPVCDEAGAVVGVLNIYEVLADEQCRRPADRMLEPLFLPEGMTITDALYRMQRAHKMMAIVGSEAQRPAGIVTIKDLVEEIVGDLEAW